MRPAYLVPETDSRPAGSRQSIHVTAKVLTGRPATIVPKADEESQNFTEDVFEKLIDRVSRPVKGKYADVLPSSEEFIRDKRKEVELEDR